ncbi:MAG: NAD-dependent epimerase/dehydratase family protein, partial [Endomicrobiia bacterium]|nr:NAD-dependent epimerase/dehydratase family protein [Endomicrobiia bacterium]
LNGIDTVLHQAALRSVPRSVDDPISSNDVNATGTLELLMAARAAGARRVVYASSSSVYGDSKIFPQKESHPTSPLSPYAVSKLAGENYCRVFSKTFGLETVSLRYFNVFGPRQNPESKYAAVIPKFIESASLGRPLEVHGDGKQSRDFSHVYNVARANLLAASAPSSVARSGQVFNIACGETHSLVEIIRILERIFGAKLHIGKTPSRAGDVRKTRADISSARKTLGYEPSVGFEDGLKMTVAWFLGNKNPRLLLTSTEGKQ